VVESDAIQSAFTDIWAQSNYDPSAPHSQRREHGGWITSDGAGEYRFEPFPSTWERTPCAINFPSSVTPPSNLVAWVHTHPYTNGDVMTECDKISLPGGLQRPFTYRGDPSYDDDEMTRTLRQNGYPNVRGYIIDADKITWYTGDDTPTTVGNYPRCGY
jgi:hypothetical protein